MKTLLEKTPDYIYFKDKNRRFVLASNSFSDLFNRSLEEIIGKTDEELFPPEIVMETVRDDRHVIETGTPLIDKEEGGELISGQEPWVLTTKLPWYDKDGNIIGLFGISKDITERKKGEQALRESQERFLLSQLANKTPQQIYTQMQGRMDNWTSLADARADLREWLPLIAAVIAWKGDVQ